MSYRSWLLRLQVPWLVGRARGKAYWGAIGDVLDEQVQRLIEAVQARFASKAPSDALPYKASERQIFQGSAESEDGYRVRLRQAWDAWPFAAMPFGLLTQLYHEGYTDAILVQQNGLYHRLTGAPSLANYEQGELSELIAPFASSVRPSATPIAVGNPWWTFDNNIEFCSRFALLLPTQPAGLWTAGVPTDNALADLRRTIKLWRPGKATCVGIYALVSGEHWGWPLRTWGALPSWSELDNEVLAYSAT